MNGQTNNRIDEIYWIASQIECDEARRAYLQTACDEPMTRQRVDELLAAQEFAHDYLEKPAAIVDPNKLPQSNDGAEIDVPPSIGPYRIHEKIGEGGMGVVYVAEQIEPVKRLVALKIIKLGISWQLFDV